MAEVAEKGDAEEKRSVMISVRLTKEDADGLRSEAAAAGESMSDFLRKQLLNRTEEPAPAAVVTEPALAPPVTDDVAREPAPAPESVATSELTATPEPTEAPEALEALEALNTLPFSETVVTAGVSLEYREGRLLPLSDRPFVTPLSPA